MNARMVKTIMKPILIICKIRRALGRGVHISHNYKTIPNAVIQLPGLIHIQNLDYELDRFHKSFACFVSKVPTAIRSEKKLSKSVHNVEAYLDLTWKSQIIIG